MKYFSLFSGIGGFEYGINRAYKQSSPNLEGVPSKGNQPNSPNILRGASYPVCVGFSEIDRYAIQIYKKHYPSHKEYGNVTNIKCSDVPDFELLCGGFPCQSFSIAGKRGGFSDTRGTLFFEIARVAQEKQPRFLLLENVKGLLSHDKGKTFGVILNTLDELGYDLQWQVLNSKNFGVPQNRERVFIIGHLRTTSRPQVFPLLRSGSENIKSGRFYKRDTGRLSPGESRQEKIEHPGDTYNQKQWESSLSKSGSSTYITTTDITGVTYALDACYSKGDNRPSNKSNRPRILDSGKIRRLTPTECERLQGFPDGWTEKGIDLKGNEILISDTQRYKCLGNAVTTNVISAIMEKLLDFPRRIR